MGKKLRRDEPRLTAVLESIGDALVATNARGRVVLMNPAAEALTGWKQEDAVGRHLIEVVNTTHGEASPLTESLTIRTLLERTVVQLACHPVLIAKDGTQTPIDGKATPTRDGNNKITGIVLVFRGITESKRAEEAQDEYEVRYRTLLESIPSSLVVVDRSLRVVSANRNFLEKAQREEHATLGRKVEQVLPQVLLESTHLEQKMREIFHTDRQVEGGKVAYRAPGLPVRTYYYRLIPLKEGNDVKNVMLLMDDISAQEQLAEEMRRVERHLASVVECANDLVISLDPQGCIVTWNQAVERTLGLAGEQIKGQSLLSLCGDEQRPVMAQMLQRLACGESVQNVEVSLLTAAGRQVSIAWSCSPMPDEASRVVGIVAMGRDLTEQRLLEAQLFQSAKMASLGVMAGGIAHEVRNPLSIISASAQLLLEWPEDEGLRKECAQKIQAATQRASHIIESLLKFSRPLGERMRDLDLSAVLAETFVLMASHMISQKVILRQQIQPDLPMVHGNGALLQQVFTNLILNACNAMPQGGSLTVTACATDAGRVELQFADTGCGIPQEHLNKIFDPFFATMRAGKGAGLGLSISYSIIQQHRGDIRVESQVGVGTTFIISLPALA